MSSEEFCSLIGREKFTVNDPIGRDKSSIPRQSDSSVYDNDHPSHMIALENNGAKKQCTLIGLHTCGDLASTMLKVFHKTKPICNIISVSCCYFRMTLKSDIEETKPCCPTLPPDTNASENREMNSRLCCCRFTLPILHANYKWLKEKNTEIEERPCLHLDENHKQYGFPLSHFLHTIPVHPLKYKSFETACHFLGDYADKLLGKI